MRISKVNALGYYKRYDLDIHPREGIGMGDVDKGRYWIDFRAKRALNHQVAESPSCIDGQESRYREFFVTTPMTPEEFDSIKANISRLGVSNPERIAFMDMLPELESTLETT